MVTELWRYELETGKRERFAIIFEGEERGIAIDDSSPERIKLYLGLEPESKTEMPVPKWEILWSLTQKRTSMDVWLNDFSSVVGTFVNYELKRRGIEVEVFLPRRKVFTVYPRMPEFFYPLLADSERRVFIRTQEMQAIERCEIDIDNETISCTEVLDINGNAESSLLTRDGLRSW